MGLLLAVLGGFAAAALAPGLHRLTGRATGWVLAAVPASITAFLAAQVPRVRDGDVLEVRYRWLAELDVAFALRLDGLSLFFALLVAGIGVLVCIYSAGYLGRHEHAGRFFAYLLLFMASMLGLVLADDVVTLYVFFELTSVASYLLIAFEHEEEEARRAAWQALLVTNAGGLALLAGVLLMGLETGTYAVSEIVTVGDALRTGGLYLPILVLVAMGAFTKSAQFPFYFWLPNAMEAPTPVSAYLHSATMVKAGIYVLARFSPALGGTEAWTGLLVGVGGFTMLVTAWLALAYTDLKRILAYSTIMVLGLLTMLLGLGGTTALEACFVFLAAHALYKAALFMVAGAVDHETGVRDVTQLGGLRRAMPVTFGAALVAAASMAGLPPLLGFVGKELVYDAALHAPGLPALVTATTVAASVALVAAAALVAVRPFFGTETEGAAAAHRAPPSLWLGPVVLAGLGLILGVAPGLVDGALVAPAVSAVRAEATEVHLALWHGWTAPLGLSAVTVAAGAAVALGWGRVRDGRGLRALARGLGEGLDRAYERSIDGLVATARGEVRVLQPGSLRFYVRTVVAVTAVLGGAALAREALFVWPRPALDVLPYEAMVAVLIVAAAGAAVGVRSRLGAVLSASVVGFGVAVLYLFFSAPDLALTQLVVETLIVILVVLVLIELPEEVPEASRAGRLRDAAVAVALGAVMTGLMLAALAVPFDEAVSSYYVQNSYAEAHGRNIVNVILVDFRALDTLGEITVLSVAGLSIYSFIRLGARAKRRRPGATDHAAEEDPS